MDRLTIAEALQILAPLAAATNGWDEPRITFWAQRICELPNATQAVATAYELADTWTELAAPPWGTFLGMYHEAIRQQALHAPTPTLPPAHSPRLTRLIGNWADRPDVIAHNHRKGAENCPSCSRHHGCETGFCPRCRQLEQWLTTGIPQPLEETA